MTKRRFKVAHRLAKIRPKSKRSVQIARFRCVIGPDLPVPGSRFQLVPAGILVRSRYPAIIMAETAFGYLIKSRRSSRCGFDLYLLYQIGIPSVRS